jgi:hypothetical protein
MTDLVYALLLMIALGVLWQTWLFEEQRQSRKSENFHDHETAISTDDSRDTLLKVSDVPFRDSKADPYVDLLSVLESVLESRDPESVLLL